jgi:acyl-CoA reductase-like NAD-dependent aldehyde dehydrogenase
VRVVLATVLVFVAAGCGGGSERLSRKEYVAKLNAECADFAARERKIGEPSTLSDVAARGERIADAFDAAIRDPQQGLRPPSTLDERAEQLRANANLMSRNLHALAAAARAGDGAKVSALATENAALNARSNRLEVAIEACTGEPG